MNGQILKVMLLFIFNDAKIPSYDLIKVNQIRRWCLKTDFIFSSSDKLKIFFQSVLSILQQKTSPNF